jgi:hypothetical protein
MSSNHAETTLGSMLGLCWHHRVVCELYGIRRGGEQQSMCRPPILAGHACQHPKQAVFPSMPAGVNDIVVLSYSIAARTEAESYEAQAMKRALERWLEWQFADHMQPARYCLTTTKDGMTHARPKLGSHSIPSRTRFRVGSIGRPFPSIHCR